MNTKTITICEGSNPTRREHSDALDAALHLIRTYINQPNTVEDIANCKLRAQSVMRNVRADIEELGKCMLMDFEVGAVACIVSHPKTDYIANGSKCLSFGVHALEQCEIDIGATVVPLYK
jgi:hypothetical protein